MTNRPWEQAKQHEIWLLSVNDGNYWHTVLRVDEKGPLFERINTGRTIRADSPRIIAGTRIYTADGWVSP